ncbi:MAG TPA: peptide ABC transporter substrate-binding protein [Polyangiaceae bacterium]
MYRTLIGILAVFALTLLVAGATFRASIEGPADFRFANGTEPKTLDPHLATGEPEGRLISELFEGLTRLEAKTLKPAPGVAESWEISPDGKKYTFRLRRNALWTDGKPVTAHDFAYSYRRLLTPELGSEYSYILSPIRLAVELNTFDALATVVTKAIRPGFAKLSAESPGDLSANAWQKFLAETKAHEALQHAEDPLVTRLVAQRTGKLPKSDLDAFSAALGRLEKQLRAGAAHARAHFGVDEGAFAVDDHTFVIELRAPTPYFLELTSFYPAKPVPRHLLETTAKPDAWFLPETIVSNGPYRLERWSVNDRVRLVRNESYWRKAEVAVKTIDAYAIESATTALNLYLTGAIDWLPKQYPKDLVDIVKKHPDFYAQPGLVIYYYRLNTTRPPLNDRRVRQAINLAVDRNVIVRDVLGLGQIAATTFVPPGLASYEPPASAIRLDVAKARALLDEAGFPGGKNFPKIGILYNTNEDHKKIAEVIADQLRRNLGIQVQPYNQEWQSYLETTRQLDYEMARAGWVGDYNDPNTFLDLWVTNGPNNQTGFASARYDRLIRLAADVSPLIDDPEPAIGHFSRADEIRGWIAAARSAGSEGLEARERIRMALFQEAEAILVNEEFPILPLYFYVNSGFIRKNVRGFYTVLEQESGKTAINLKDLHPLSAILVEQEGGGAP